MTPPHLDPKKAMGITKPQLQLIPPILNVELAAALQNGIDKGYGPFNWRTGNVEMMTYLGAIKRHVDDILSGEDIAADSGVTHLGHIAANCAIILDAKKHGTLVDNRPPAAGMKKQRQEAEETMAKITGAKFEWPKPAPNKTAPRCYGTYPLHHPHVKAERDCESCIHSAMCHSITLRASAKPKSSEPVCPNCVELPFSDTSCTRCHGSGVLKPTATGGPEDFAS